MVLGSQTGQEYYLKVIPSLIYLLVYLVCMCAVCIWSVDIILFDAIKSESKMDALSSGLRIAPPEAPVTGYMFGKGVYFADMFSKSANYCYATHTAADGVLLLSEVVFCPIVNIVALPVDLLFKE